MDNRPIGIFDSGLGGLTCVKEVMKTLPKENVVYFGDTGRVPYGTRSPETIIKYSVDDVNFLKSLDIKAVVIACGTVSSIAIDHLKSSFDLPITGVVKPAALAAAKATKSNRIGIIGTSGTVFSGKYEQEIRLIKEDVFVVSKACPLFVPLVENGFINHEATRIIAEEYLKEIKSENVDTLIMGCTHYPLIRELIADIMGPEVTLIDPGLETALYLKEFLKEENLCGDSAQANYSFYVSDSPGTFEKLGGMFLCREICGKVAKIDIENF